MGWIIEAQEAVDCAPPGGTRVLRGAALRLGRGITAPQSLPDLLAWPDPAGGVALVVINGTCPG
jgi:hypothetical protein